MADTDRRIKHGTVNELAPELVPRGVRPDTPCALVREGDMVALVPYSAELVDMLTSDGLDKMVNGMADAEFATLGC